MGLIPFADLPPSFHQCAFTEGLLCAKCWGIVFPKEKTVKEVADYNSEGLRKRWSKAEGQRVQRMDT